MTYTKLSVAVRLVQRKYLWRLTTMSAFRQLRVPCVAISLCFSLSLFRACLVERVPSSLPPALYHSARPQKPRGASLPSTPPPPNHKKSVRVHVRVQPRAEDVLFHFKIAGSWRRTVVSAVSHCGACGGRERGVAQHAYPGVRGGLPLWLFVGSRVGVSFVWAACGHGGGSCDVGGSGAARLGV
jgi:hypothetical protein